MQTAFEIPQENPEPEPEPDTGTRPQETPADVQHTPPASRTQEPRLPEPGEPQAAPEPRAEDPGAEDPGHSNPNRRGTRTQTGPGPAPRRPQPLRTPRRTTTPPATSRSSRGWRPSGRGRACTSAQPTCAASTTSSTRSSTTPWTRPWPATATRSRSASPEAAWSPCRTTAGASRSTNTPPPASPRSRPS